MLALANGESRGAMTAARQVLLKGGSALDAVERGIREVEADLSVHTVGRGGAPDLCGDVSCDASIMDGRTRRAGSVGALRGYLHAVSAARQVMEQLPHVLLVGDGAARFCREAGLDQAEMLTEEMRRKHAAWLDRHGGPGGSGARLAWISGDELVAGGTSVLLSIDRNGDLAVGASSSGWAHKYPGRLGDSGIVGAGVYADNRYGACACTHTGERTIRASTSHSVVLYMSRGATVREACQEAARDLRTLEGGYHGPVAMHAMDCVGNVCVATTEDLGPRIDYCLWRDGMTQPETYLPTVMGA